MKFHSTWITTEPFAALPPTRMYHKEHVPFEAPKTLSNYHTHFRRRFTLTDTDGISIRISADDYYKLYVNGTFVCQGPAPAYPENYKYNQVDLTPYVSVGENVIAVHVYYQGAINRVWVSGDNRQGMIADVFRRGEFLFGTDESWLYSEPQEFQAGNTLGYSTAYLENIDFTLEEKGWTTVDYDDSHYRPAIVDPNADYIFCDTPAQVLAVYKVKPKEIVKKAPGSYFIDFGQEYAGQFFMSMCGTKGQQVRILCGEELSEDEPQMVRYAMRCNCVYDEVCTLSGERDDFSFFDYKTFRYVNIITDEDNLEPDTFAMIVRHHPFEEILTLHSDIPYLQEIWDLCRNGVKYGSQEALLDCPHREKGLYLGDFTVSGLAHLYLTGDAEYYRKTLYDFAVTADICPGLLAVANSSKMQEIADFSLQYALQLLNYYKYTGDINTLRELYPVACGILDYFSAYEREDGLLENVKEKWNLVDWPQNLRDGYEASIDPKASYIDCHNVLNAFYIGAMDATNHIAGILGLPPYREAAPYRAAFIRAFYDSQTGLFRDSEHTSHTALHSNVLPVCFGIAEPAAYDRIRALIIEKQLSCGVQFSYFVLKALAHMDAHEELLALIINESEHSWVNMLRDGATTCMEAWGKDQKRNCSMCHPWASSPIIAIVEDLNGRFGISVEKNS